MPLPGVVRTVKKIFTDDRSRSLVVHDLRTPLNAVALTLSLFERILSESHPELDEDLALMRLSLAEHERMLKCLNDASHAPDDASILDPRPFDLAALVADAAACAASELAAECVLEVESSPGPVIVVLDRGYATLAVRHALGNSVASADGRPIRLAVTSAGDRRRVEFKIVGDPPQTVSPALLRPNEFVRILGGPAERRGLDLAIAAQISELFGGSARIEVEPGVCSAVVLDWPSRTAARAGLPLVDRP